MKFVIIHQHDPTIPGVGGIGTFIDAFIRNSPENIEINLIGVTAQPDRYPVGQWHSVSTGKKSFLFFPLVAANPVHITFIPLTMKMLLALLHYRKHFDLQDAILEFHRIEPILAFLKCDNPMVLFLHGHNLKDFYNKNTEVRWGKIPWLYLWLEKILLPRASHIHIVREDAVNDYKEKYKRKADDISFIPTWVDETVFKSLNEEERYSLRNKLAKKCDISASSKIFLFVGRYEGQKNPIRLLEAFKLVRARYADAVLILIGDGSLKNDMKNYVQQQALTPSVLFLPAMTQQEISQWMNAADVFCLSSAFEGMPFVILEALYSGLPVVSTAVGEATRLLGNSQGGRLVTNGGAEPFANAMIDLLTNPPTREACNKQVESYTAQNILAPVYQYHCTLLKINK